MEPWEGVVQIPEGKVGAYEIRHMRHPAGKPVLTSNFRTAIFRGQADKNLVFDRETVWHELLEDGVRWMSDLPIEQIQHDQELEEFCGECLVGGLGIGYAVNVLAARASVTKVVVVEISPEIVELVGPHIIDPDGKVEIVTEDLFDYLRRGRKLFEEEGCPNELYFDWAFYDIWRSDGEGTFHETVVPLRELSEEWIDNVVCWNESVMRGQLIQNLTNRWMFTMAREQAAALDTDKITEVIESGGTKTLEEAQVEALVHAVRSWDQYPTREQLAVPRPESEAGAIFHNWACPFWEGVAKGVVNGKNYQRAIGHYAGTYGHPGWKLWWRAVMDGYITIEDDNMPEQESA